MVLSVGVVVIPVSALFLGLFFEPGLFEPVVVFGGGDGLSVASISVFGGGLVVVGSWGFAEGGFGAEDAFGGFGGESALFVDGAVGDAALVFVVAVGADDEGFVAGLGVVEGGEEVVFAFAAIEFLGGGLVGGHG